MIPSYNWNCYVSVGSAVSLVVSTLGDNGKGKSLPCFKILECIWLSLILFNPASPLVADVHTTISMDGDNWLINNNLTYAGSQAEGLLMNVRMVNAVFEDRARPEFDAPANTREFIAQIPEYVSHGVLAFTISLQGGFPGYEEAVNSAFTPDGSLRPSYLQRVAGVIRACNQHGAVVILGCYYQRQDQVLKDDRAVCNGVMTVADWIRRMQFGNVVLEIANEFGHQGYDHPSLKTAKGQVELIRLAKRVDPKLLVSSSGLGNGRLPDNVARESDFLLIHFNTTKLSDYVARIDDLKKYDKPIVCNEDEAYGEYGARAAQLCVDNKVSWGLMQDRVNQHFPFHFQGVGDDEAVYQALQSLTLVPTTR